MIMHVCVWVAVTECECAQKELSMILFTYLKTELYIDLYIYFIYLFIIMYIHY